MPVGVEGVAIAVAVVVVVVDAAVVHLFLLIHLNPFLFRTTGVAMRHPDVERSAYIL